MQRRLSLLLILATVGAVGAVGWFVAEGSLSGPPAYLDRGSEGVGLGDGGSAGPEGGVLRAAPGAKAPPTVEELEAMREAARKPAFDRSEGVFGRVVDGSGDPVEGAIVKLLPRDASTRWARIQADPPAMATALTEEDGTYLVGPAPEGARLRMRVEASGYAPSVKMISTRGYRVDVVLDRGGALEVTVKDGEGAVVAGAKVLHSIGNYVEVVVTEATTNENGVASFPSVPTGTGNVLVTADGKAGIQQGGVGVAPGQTEKLTIVLPEPLRIEGRVLTEGVDLPIAGASIRLAYPNQPWLQPSEPVTSDDAGHYEIEALAPQGQWVSMEVSAPDRPDVTLWPQLQDAGDRRMTYDVHVPTERGVFEGRVYGSTGQPVSGARVTYPYVRTGQDRIEVTTGSDGRFELPAASWITGKNQATQIVALAEGEGIGSAYGHMPKEGEGPKPVEIRLGGTGRVGGTVTDGGGSPVAGALVRLEVDWQLMQSSSGRMDWGLVQMLQDPTLTDLEAVTGEDGSFLIADAPAMTYRLTVSSGLDTVIDPDPVTVSGAAQLNRQVVLGEGLTVEGWVRDTDGQGIPGALVSANPSRQPGGPGTSKGLSGRSQSDGRFVLHGATDGTYRVYAQAAGYRSESENGVTGGRTDLVLTLVPLGWIDGRVEYAGRGYAGTFTVTATPVKEQPQRARSVRYIQGVGYVSGGGSSGTFSPDDGTFHLESLSGGEYDLIVRTPEGYISTQAVRVRVTDGRGSEAAVTLSEGSVIKGRLVSDETNQPIAGAHIWASGHSADGALPSASARTDDQGHYVLRGLGTGAYVVRVQPPSGVNFEEAVDLQVGEQRLLDLRERPPGAIRTLVVDESGAVVPYAQIVVQTEGGQPVWPNWQALQREGVKFTANTWNELRQTDGSGVNLWRHLAPGPYRLQVTPSPRTTQDGHSYRTLEPTTVVVKAGRTTDVTLAVQEISSPKAPVSAPPR
jgi:protocatechuate 3,4-dioxygenase beta subunit